MAYVLVKTQLKDGDTAYNISNACRIPGSKNKQRRVTVETYHASDLAARGLTPDTFIRERMEILRREAKAVVKTVDYSIDMGMGLELSSSGDLQVSDDSRNLGYAAYSCLYHSLELDELVNNRRKYAGCEFNINTIFQHLVYSRLIWPASKKNTWEHTSRFFGNTGYDLQHVYRSMDHLLGWRTDILSHLDSRIRKQYGRRNTIVFYDVTNYYFELDSEDGADGLRANGVSKEHKPEPIIQMGLFMDELGLPITYELFRGNTNDCVTMHEAMDECIIDFSASRKIIVADKGMMSYYNILRIREANNGYVISQSIRKSDEETKQFALCDDGWEVQVDGNGEIASMAKERILPRKASAWGDVDGRRHSGTYNERQVFIWSKKYSDRAKHDRQAAIEKAMKYDGRASRDMKDSNYGKNKYLRKNPQKDGTPVEHDGCVYELDWERIAEDERYDGYYLICTNVIGAEKPVPGRPPDFAYYRNDGFLVLNHEVTAQEIANIYGGLWKIEETFKVTKTGMLNLRPVFHSNQDRIRAHFLICFVSLVLERLLEYRMGWKYSAKTIQNSLSLFNAALLPNSNIYHVTYYDAVVKEILETLGIDISRKFLQQSDIRRIFGETKKKVYEGQ